MAYHNLAFLTVWRSAQMLRERGMDVDLVWSPLWHPTMMSDFAKDELGYDDEFGFGVGYY